MSFSAFPVPPQKTLCFVFVRSFQRSSVVSDVVGDSERFLRHSHIWFLLSLRSAAVRVFSDSFRSVLLRVDLLCSKFYLYVIGCVWVSLVVCWQARLSSPSHVVSTVACLLLGFQRLLYSESYGY